MTKNIIDQSLYFNNSSDEDDSKKPNQQNQDIQPDAGLLNYMDETRLEFIRDEVVKVEAALVSEIAIFEQQIAERQKSIAKFQTRL